MRASRRLSPARSKTLATTSMFNLATTSSSVTAHASCFRLYMEEMRFGFSETTHYYRYGGGLKSGGLQSRGIPYSFTFSQKKHGDYIVGIINTNTMYARFRAAYLSTYGVYSLLYVGTKNPSF